MQLDEYTINRQMYRAYGTGDGPFDKSTASIKCAGYNIVQRGPLYYCGSPRSSNAVPSSPSRPSSPPSSPSSEPLPKAPDVPPAMNPKVKPGCEECGNVIDPRQWLCYLGKAWNGCGGSTGLDDVLGKGDEDLPGNKQSICAKDCSFLDVTCTWAKMTAGCGGFGLGTMPPWLIVVLGLVGAVIVAKFVFPSINKVLAKDVLDLDPFG